MLSHPELKGSVPPMAFNLLDLASACTYGRRNEQVHDKKVYCLSIYTG